MKFCTALIDTCLNDERGIGKRNLMMNYLPRSSFNCRYKVPLMKNVKGRRVGEILHLTDLMGVMSKIYLKVPY